MEVARGCLPLPSVGWGSSRTRRSICLALEQVLTSSKKAPQPFSLQIPVSAWRGDQNHVGEGQVGPQPRPSPRDSKVLYPAASARAARSWSGGWGCDPVLFPERKPSPAPQWDGGSSSRRRGGRARAGPHGGRVDSPSQLCSNSRLDTCCCLVGGWLCFPAPSSRSSESPQDR